MVINILVINIPPPSSLKKREKKSVSPEKNDRKQIKLRI